MDSTNYNPLKSFSKFTQTLQFNLHQTLNNLQNNCGAIQTQFHSAFSDLQTHTKHAFDTIIPRFNPNSPFPRNAAWARIGDEAKGYGEPVTRSSAIRSNRSIEERLAGVPVYALSNSDQEFVLVSGSSIGTSLGLLCFRKEDAEALLEQMKSMDPEMRRGGSKVVAVSLSKVCQLKVDGVAFRLIPDSAEIKNALMARQKLGLSSDGFSGIPVFQSRSLVLRSQNKSYRPVFFKKEDLERSLVRASQQQRKINPVLKQGDIEVAVFEEIIKGMQMQESSTLKWDDVVFIPPGFDVSIVPSEQ
ncbi:chloroplast inner membrane import protein Tic22 [Tripterygium wilfordii]|uniref:Chloroplast inner membrane import protein Tic22 n=1 Tax=Tripterygium wilfordii TaxID=458696 RepID=A0A7J7CX70_TRIWF|nr:protein TIC 22-like, chloroplastic [Tripterygium wilfordii]KAF5738486.1 chloroplast inner membrane import protein Tic22 [Tripterygium wilfordii]